MRNHNQIPVKIEGHLPAHDIFFYNGSIIDIYERREDNLPFALKDIESFYKYIQEAKMNTVASFECILREVWYDNDNGNMGWMNIDIVLLSKITRENILKIGMVLDTDVYWNNWCWHLCWSIKTIDELEKKYNFETTVSQFTQHLLRS